MTVRALPEVIDALQLLDQRRELSGVVALCQMSRLAQGLADQAGEAAVRLAFTRDEARRPVIRGHVHAELTLICQRCLQPMPWVVDAEMVLGLCTSEQEMEQLPDAYEPVLLEGRSLRPAELVEDELILALPVLARHEGDPRCPPLGPASSGGAEVDRRTRRTPFAVLGVLRGQDGR